MRGKTISIFIPDSNPRGIKICDIKDSIVKAIFIPRNKLENVSKRSDISDPGIYFLIGEEDEIGKWRIYIGEAENLLTRVKQHNSGKDFWNTAICFVSEKRNINKAHIKYLENHCVEEAKRVNKCKIENGTIPTQSTLTEQDIDFMLSFFDDLKILIATLGFPIFEENIKEKKNIFICKGKESFAEGEYSEDGMTVYVGARISISEAPAIGAWASKIRSSLIEQGVMIKEGETYVLKETYTFKSPSAAAAVILGRSANGWTEWKNKNGETLDKRYRNN